MSETEFANAIKNFAPAITVFGLGLILLFQGLTNLGEKKTRCFGLVIIGAAIAFWLLLYLAVKQKCANNNPWLEDNIACITIFGVGINILFQGLAQYRPQGKKWPGIPISAFGALITFAGLFILFILWGDSYCCALIPTVVLFIFVFGFGSICILKRKNSSGCN